MSIDKLAGHVRSFHSKFPKNTFLSAREPVNLLVFEQEHGPRWFDDKVWLKNDSLKHQRWHRFLQ